ncbi:MAG TPA: SLATT domain-containing protein [Opitutaceae bacterium]|nr:SLATT domain-containing protein [Opitutaceae bacterium]
MNAPSSLPQFHIVGFTGHRQLDQPRLIQDVLRAILEQLRREGPGEWIALSSAAAGADTLFARQALAAGLAWHVVLPLPPAEFRKDFSPEEWKTVEALLPEAGQVRVIGENGARDDNYLDCGMETVNGCDVFIALWDGRPARGKGGTAEVVAYARELKKPLVIIDAATFEARRENFARFAPHDHNLAYFNALPRGPEAPAVVAEAAVAPAFERITAFQRKVDLAASRGAPQYRRLIASIVVLHVLATLIAAAALAFEWHFATVPWLKLFCLLGALGVALALRYAGTHHHWVHCRLAAEITRSALATWGLPRAAPLFEDLDLAEFRQLTRTLHILHRRAAAAQPVPMAAFKQSYLAHRVDDQLAYYRHRLDRALPLLNRLRLGFWIATVLAILCTAAYALHLGELRPGTEELLYYFLPIALPVVAAAFISLISVYDLQRRVARYRETEHLLESSRSQITFSQTWTSLERIVQKTERALLQEVLEWHAITSFAESH